jgi:dTDP-4-dehydrorhamnose reductase
LNCGAYTAVDKAETETELADIVNHQAVKVIAHANDNQVKLIHVSTDYVLMDISDCLDRRSTNLSMFMVLLKSR